MEKITSLQNALIKKVQALRESRERREAGDDYYRRCA